LNYKDKYEFIAYADELIAYGIYKELESNLLNIEDKQKLVDAYKKVISRIDLIIKENIEEHKKVDKTFSYSSYFKKPKCRIDYNKISSIVESDEIKIDVLNK
jgi:translation elongation factor EF-1beta